MFLKNRNISSKIKRSKVTDYAALRISISTITNKACQYCYVSHWHNVDAEVVDKLPYQLLTWFFIVTWWTWCGRSAWWRGVTWAICGRHGGRGHGWRGVVSWVIICIFVWIFPVGCLCCGWCNASLRVSVTSIRCMYNTKYMNICIFQKLNYIRYGL